MARSEDPIPDEPAIPLTHWHYCLAVVEWMIGQSWCYVCGPEVSYGRGVADVLGASLEPPSIRNVEVKRTRNDLLSDLRAKKMLRTYRYASHNYLALADACYLADSRSDRLSELSGLGLPVEWGVLRLYVLQGRSGRPILHPLGHQRIAVESIRSARKTTNVRTPKTQKVVRAIGRSLSWRVLKPPRKR